MALPEQFKIGLTYDFISYAPALTGSYKNVRVEGICDYKTVQQYTDPAALHANIYGSLPENSAPDDYRRYHYLILTTMSGQRMAIGIPHIDGDSIQIKERTKIHLTIEDVGASELPRLKDALLANGFTISRLEIE